MKRKITEKGKKAKKRILIDSISILFIVMAPFIFKVHEYVSTNPNATLNFLGYVFDSNGFQNISVYVWFLLGKIVPLYLLVIWFLTCKHWWYHIILIPITMYAFQIFEGVFSEDYYIDSENLLWLLPVCMIVIPFVYLIRIKLYDKYVHGIDLEAMEAELIALKKKQTISSSLKNEEKLENQETKGYQTLSEKLDEKLSTENLELLFKRLWHNLNNWLHLKF